MTHTPQAQMDAFVTAAHQVAAEQLVRCSSGNLSLRVDDELALVTTARSWMADLTASQIAVCRIDDGTPLNDVKPSAECKFHTGILRTRPDVHVVLHFQSPYATTLACCDGEGTDFSVIVEIPYYLGPPAFVPYYPPGSDALAEAVITAMQNHDVAVLRNHGQVTVGQTFEEAIQNAVFFELACSILVRGGGRARPLSADDTAHLRQLGSGRQRGPV